jgi:plastocyanin
MMSPSHTCAVIALLSMVIATGCGPQRVSAPVADAAAAVKIREGLAGSAAAAAGGEQAVATGTGWATLKGRFVFAGNPGQPKPLVVDKDTEVCGKSSKLFDQSLRVDASSKGLADVVVFVRKANRVKDPVSTTPVVFDQKNCEFLSPVFAARVGQPVEVRNSDPVGHNTNIDGSSFNQLIPAGQGTTYKPDSETGAPKAVTCNIHPWMKAYVVFRKDGYVAVTAADGSFAIPDLPAGEPLEFQVWHARATGSGGGLVIERPDLKWNPKGRFVITLQADEVKDLGTLDVPAGSIGT